MVLFSSSYTLVYFLYLTIDYEENVEDSMFGSIYIYFLISAFEANKMILKDLWEI